MGGLRINKISKALGAFTGSSSDPLLTSNATTGKVDTATNSFSSLPNGTIWIGNASNVPVPNLISGDITISNAGVAAIGAGVIVNADISASAAITLTKLAPLGFSLALVSDGAGFIVTSLTTAAQIGFLSTTTSDVQVQINAKQGTITGAASTVVTANLNPNIVTVTDGSGKFISSTTSVTALGFINNLTSDAQAQINQKLTVALGVAAIGDLLYYNGSNWTNFPKGTNGQILTTSGGTLSWGSATANGLPVGGTAAQFLAKLSGANFDAGWFTLTTSLITDILATAAQINASTTYLTAAGVPTGTNNQVLTISGGIMGWSSVGTGTVTSINVTGGTTGLTFSGGPITTSGTITMAGTLGVVNGGTNQTAVAIGDLLYGSGVNTWSRLGAGTNGFVLTMAAGIPSWVAPGAGSFWVVNGATALTANTSQTGNFTNTFALNRVNIQQNAQSGATPISAFTVNAGTHTNVSVEVSDVIFNLARNITYVTGTLPLHRSVLITNPTINFVGASVATTAGTLVVTGAPFGGTNATISSSSAILVTTASVGNVTASYGINVTAMGGAVSNYAAAFLGGNVGIGTSVPISILHLLSGGNTDLNLDSTLATASPIILFKNNTGIRRGYLTYDQSILGMSLATDGNNPLSLRTNNLDRVTILGSGFVGINNNNPTALLQITSGASNVVNINLSTAFNGASLRYTATSVNNIDQRLSFFMGSGEVFTVLNDGKTGIGTINPQAPLEVQAAVNTLGIISSTNGVIANGTHDFFRGVYNASATTLLSIGFNSTGSNNPDNIFITSPNNLPLVLQRGSGRVGIGLVPQAPLEVLGQAGTVIIRQTSSLSYSSFRVYNDLNISNRSLEIDYTGSAYASGVITGAASGEQGAVYTTGAFPLYLGTNNTARISITGSGAITFVPLGGSGLTTATLDANGRIGRTTALSYDISNNVLLNNDLYFTNGVNIFTGLITGTMFGTSDLQKLSFYGQIPDRQPDTGVTPLTKLTFGGSPVGELDTFGGYTIGQVVAALQQLGLLQ